jgi:tetratricopeptide (TPR) repeat protein
VKAQRTRRPTALPNSRTAARAVPFIQGAFADGLWVIFCPLVALAVLAGLWAWSGLSDLAIFAVLFGFIVTGHHLPGWFRAFGEPAIYNRYRARLWTSLVAIPPLVILPTAFGLGAAALTVAALFDLWHVAMQQHGFGRIYAAKAGDTSKSSARLDLACVLVWYGTAVAWSDAWMQGIARVLRKAGVPVFDLLTPGLWRGIRLGLLAVSVGLLAAYVAGAVRRRREGISTPRKHLLHLVAFAVIVYSYQFASWYRAQSVQNLFHALQYFFIVWIYAHLSVRREGSASRKFYRALFRGRAGLIVFGSAIALYGAGAIALSSSGYRLTGVDAERTAQVIGSIGLASLLLHFYVDSFIWKVRSKEVRATFAIQDRAGSSPSPAVALREPAWRGALHAAGYFGVPVLLLVLAGLRSKTVSESAARPSISHEAELFPKSAMARFESGRAAVAANDAPTARRELSASLSLAPSFQGPAALLFALDRAEGNRPAAIDHGRLAVEASPRDAGLRYDFANALASEKRLEEAQAEYREVLRLKPDFAGAEENLAVTYKWQDRLDLAIPHFRRASKLDPNLTEASLNLAGSLATLGRVEESLSVMEAFLRDHPGDPAGMELDARIRAAASPRR